MSSDSSERFGQQLAKRVRRSTSRTLVCIGDFRILLSTFRRMGLVWLVAISWFCSQAGAQPLPSFSSAPLRSRVQQFANDVLGVPSAQARFTASSVSSSSSIDGARAVETLARSVGDRLATRKQAARNLQTNARAAYNLEMTSQTQTLCCKLKKTDVAFESRFNTTVTIEKGCDRISSTASSPRPTISVAIKDTGLTNIRQIPELKFQYFGSEEGYSTIFPGFNTSSCSSYDPRYRPWYVAGAVPAAKDVVLVVDVSGSMGGIVDSKRTRLDLAKEAINSILSVLSDNDRVTILPFSSGISNIAPPQNNMTCFNDRLGQATPYNLRMLRVLVENLNDGGGTRYGPAIAKAYQLFEDTPNTTGRDRAILFLSDGAPNDNEDYILAAQEKAAKPFGYKIAVLTYSMGTNVAAGVSILSKMAAQTYTSVSTYDRSLYSARATGKYEPVPDFHNLRATLTRFYSLFASEDTSSAVVFTMPYYDAFGLGIILTAAAPVYTDDTSTTGTMRQTLRGVVGVDITVTDLFGDIAYFSDDEHQYAFMVNTDGEAILHPLLNQPVDISSDPLFQDITLLEIDADFAEHVYPFLRNGTGGSAVFNATRYLTIGDSQYEGTRKTTVLSSFDWRAVPGTHFVVCVVLNMESARAVSQISAQSRPSQSTVYHRLDLATLRGQQCDQFGRLAIADVSAIKLSPEAFLDPAQYLNIPESKTTVNAYVNYLDGRTSANAYLKSSVVDLVRLTSSLDTVWLSEAAKQFRSSVVWRYIGAIDGVFRLIPATQLPTSYDHLSRGWFTRSLNNPGRITLSAPYLDAFGAGYVVTLATTIRQTTGSSVSAVGAVMGMDFSMGYLNQLLLSLYPFCSSSRCFLMDTAGYLIYHPSFLASSANPERVHLGHEEPSVMKDLVEGGVLRKQSCVRYDTFKRHVTYRMVLPAGQTSVNGTAVCASWTRYKVEYLADTNMYLGVVASSTCSIYKGQGWSHVCKCSTKNGLGRCSVPIRNLDCECPCEVEVEYYPCNNTFPSSSRKFDVCPAEVVAQPVVPRKSSTVLKLEKCFNGRCSNITTSRTCQATVGCSWCTMSKSKTELDNAYCTTDCTCFQGVQGRENPNAECQESGTNDSSSGSGFNPGYIFGGLFGLFLVGAMCGHHKKRSQQNSRPAPARASTSAPTTTRAAAPAAAPAAAAATPAAAAAGTTSDLPSAVNRGFGAERDTSEKAATAPPDYDSAVTMSYDTAISPGHVMYQPHYPPSPPYPT